MTHESTGPNGDVYIVSAARTPIGKFGGALSGVPATELGAVAIRAAVERAGLDPATAPIDEVLMGQVLQAGVGQAPARQALLKAGLPDGTSATTINRVCGSGLKAIMLAAAEIRARRCRGRHRRRDGIDEPGPLGRIEEHLGRGVRVVRVMPNTPALVGKGVSVLVGGSNATVGDLRAAMRLFRAVGDALTIADEGFLDAVTGLSGSGPAYVYRFAEALIDAGTRQGLDSATASRLVFGTIAGAAAMLSGTKMTPKQLREMVSSPGGTTLAGLGALDRAGFMQAIAAAVGAATERSRELGGR